MAIGEQVYKIDKFRYTNLFIMPLDIGVYLCYNVITIRN
nr:MAG TPA: hypothetical protein [Caudoviricetes sp.]